MSHFTVNSRNILHLIALVNIKWNMNGRCGYISLCHRGIRVKCHVCDFKCVLKAFEQFSRYRSLHRIVDKHQASRSRVVYHS